MFRIWVPLFACDSSAQQEDLDFERLADVLRFSGLDRIGLYLHVPDKIFVVGVVPSRGSVDQNLPWLSVWCRKSSKRPVDNFAIL